MKKLVFSVICLLSFSCVLNAAGDNELPFSDEELDLIMSIPDQDSPPEKFDFAHLDTSLREILLQKALFLYNSDQNHLIAQFKAIDQKLRSIPNGSNVHVLDAYVFGSDNKIQELANIAEALDVDNAIHKLQEIGNHMINFVDQRPDLFVGYTYESNQVTSEKIKEYLHLHFNAMDQEVLAANCVNAQIIWSRAFSLVFSLYDFENDLSGIKMLYDAAIEGHLTQGGCLAGRINRGFVLYVALLGKYGLSDIANAS